jgi:hypothetical protein
LFSDAKDYLVTLASDGRIVWDVIRSSATIVGTLIFKDAWQSLGIGLDVQVIPLSQPFGFNNFRRARGQDGHVL